VLVPPASKARSICIGLVTSLAAMGSETVS
jgi:hypothetical protein